NISYVNNEETEQEIREIIGEWQAPLGVYCVPGTPAVEPMERVKTFTRDLDNLRLLTNSWFTIETPAGPFNILGLATTHFQEKDLAMLKKMMLMAPRTGLKLLLAHTPDLAPQADAQ